MLGDHLGSTVLVVNSSGGVVARKLYKAWGEERYASGSLGTKYEYTGQRSDNYVNLLWYNSRWYDPYITQFTQPDQIIPDPTNPLDFNRYSYVRYNPIRFNDPTGHYVCTGSNEKWGEKTCYDIVNNWLDYLYKQGGCNRPS
jgi:RHS repeat-associated protein